MRLRGPLRSAMAHVNRYLGQAEAARLDERLFSEFRFSVEQLMELAGQAVAVAAQRHLLDLGWEEGKRPARVLVAAGPGNNGGDGLVAARHLANRGFDVGLRFPQPAKPKPLMDALRAQALGAGVRVVESVKAPLEGWDLAIDALFGFSYRPPMREPYGQIVSALAASSAAGPAGRLPVLSVDVPSGWDVEAGPPDAEALRPSALVSLTAPKECARHFTGSHFLGGQGFVPLALAREMDLAIPPFPNSDLILRLPNGLHPPRKQSE